MLEQILITSKESSSTVGWTMKIMDISFGNTSTDTFTSSNSLSESNSLGCSVTYGPAPTTAYQEDGNTPKIEVYYLHVNVPKIKQACIINGSVDNEKRPWFIPTYMWNNNKSFRLVTYALKVDRSGAVDTAPPADTSK